MNLSASLEKENARGQKQLIREKELQGEKAQSQGSLKGDREGWVKN